MSNWIKIKDKVPLNGQLVYTYSSKECLFNIGHYSKEYNAVIDFDDFKIEATHWMNPVAPKEK